MPSTSIQFSLLQEEANTLLAEANRQLKVAILKREEVLFNGGADYNIKPIAPSTVATQIVRQALPEIRKRLDTDERKGIKK
jgi:hypothetical protein